MAKPISGSKRATEQDGGDGVWRTVNGVHVFIKGGKITKGPKNMVGKSAAQAAKDDNRDEERQGERDEQDIRDKRWAWKKELAAKMNKAGVKGRRDWTPAKLDTEFGDAHTDAYHHGMSTDDFVEEAKDELDRDLDAPAFMRKPRKRR